MKSKKICRVKQSKFLVSILCLTLILSTANGAFAAQKGDSDQAKSNRIADLVSDLIGNKNVLENIHEERSNYIPVTENTDISIPKSGEGRVCLSIGDEDIAMSLPDQVKNCEGVLTNEGSIVYDSQSDVDVIVQATEEVLESDEIRSTIRTMVSIASNDAPKEYSFDYDLPNGYRLMMGGELGNEEIPNDAVGIIDEDGYAVSIIDSPWAKDANGKELGTYYRIEGSKLIQTVAFDENTEFPVMADPSTIVDKRTRSTTHKVVTGWVALEGQPVDGFYFHSPGTIGGIWGKGSSKSMSVSAQLSNGTVTVTFQVGMTATSMSGGTYNLEVPVKKWVKAFGKHHLTVFEKAEDYKYRNTKVTDNGKTTTTTYQWVTVRNWVDKVLESATELSYKVVS